MTLINTRKFYVKYRQEEYKIIDIIFKCFFLVLFSFEVPPSAWGLDSTISEATATDTLWKDKAKWIICLLCMCTCTCIYKIGSTYSSFCFENINTAQMVWSNQPGLFTIHEQAMFLSSSGGSFSFCLYLSLFLSSRGLVHEPLIQEVFSGEPGSSLASK